MWIDLNKWKYHASPCYFLFVLFVNLTRKLTQWKVNKFQKVLILFRFWGEASTFDCKLCNNGYLHWINTSLHFVLLRIFLSSLYSPKFPFSIALLSDVYWFKLCVRSCWKRPNPLILIVLQTLLLMGVLLLLFWFFAREECEKCRLLSAPRERKKERKKKKQITSQSQRMC